MASILEHIVQAVWYLIVVIIVCGNILDYYLLWKLNEASPEDYKKLGGFIPWRGRYMGFFFYVMGKEYVVIKNTNTNAINIVTL